MSMYAWLDNAPFPLTPAHSLGEREKLGGAFGKLGAGDSMQRRVT